MSSTMLNGDVELVGLKSAIALYRQPLLARRMESAKLPGGMGQVLRVAAGGLDHAEIYSAECGASAKEIYESALFFLRTVVMHQNASDARVLALYEPIDVEQLRNHKRLMLKWLHPDRNHNSWESKLFLRVKTALSRLEGASKEVELPTNISEQKKVSGQRLQHSLDSRSTLKKRLGFWRSLIGLRGIKTLFAVFVFVLTTIVAVSLSENHMGFASIYEAAN